MTALRAFTAWRRQRLPLLPFVGVALVIAAAARDITVGATLTALWWVTAFRLWDDVASRHHDARRHPERVVVRGPPAPFARAAVIAVLLGGALARGIGVLPGFVAVTLGLAVVYAMPMSLPRRQLLVLLKYPAMAGLLSSSPPPSAWHLLALYGCFLVDDRLTGTAPLPLRSLPFVVTFVCLCLL